MSGGHLALVLAAGGGRRLGRPKQLLRAQGETLVHRAARLAAATAPRRLLVATGAYRDEVRAQLAALRWDEAYNPDWADGLAGSLRAAAAIVRAEALPVLVIAVDQPALAGEHLAALLAGTAAAPSGCAATLHADAPGVPAVVPPHWFDDAFPRHSDHGFRHRLAGLPAGAWHALHAPELDADIDDAAALAAAIAAGRIDPDAA